MKRLRRKQSSQLKRLQQVSDANKRMLKRRCALGNFNGLLKEAGAENLVCAPKEVPTPCQLDRVFNFLDRRCKAGAQRAKFLEALCMWVDNGGLLPEGVQLVDNILELAEDFENVAALVPQHRLLKKSFVLKSQAFMLTYNSRQFTKDTWPEFKKFIEDLAKEFGATAWACCLETGTKDATTVVFHTHAYLLWTDGVGYRSEGLQRLKFQEVRPRVDKCTQGANERVPRRAALHGLWYVAVEKLGTVSSYASFVAWQDYVPSWKWLTSLYDAHKLSYKQYLSLSAAFRSGHSYRRRDAMDARRDDNEEAVQAHVDKELQLLQEQRPRKQPRRIQAVEEYIASFRQPEWRRPVLVVVGGTNLGKSTSGRFCVDSC